jgi:hypothetical protein
MRLRGFTSPVRESGFIVLKCNIGNYYLRSRHCGLSQQPHRIKYEFLYIASNIELTTD